MSNAEGSKSPEEIRAEIEETRSNLGSDVDALADKVNPSSIAHRQTEKVKGRFTSIKESVMGSVQDAKDSGSAVGGAAADLPRKAADSAKGNALAVGLVAFGFGLLAASLFPASDKEEALAASAKEKAGPAIDAVKSAAQDVAENVKGPAQDAVGSVKDTAQEAFGTVKDEATSAAQDVKSSAQDSAGTVQNS